MMRVTSLAVFVAAVAAMTERPATAQLPVAPPPREVRADGSRDPAPTADAPAKTEDPAAVVDRIIKNSKDVGDRLKKEDAGTDTRKTQDKILSDIDALINRQDDPPPPMPDDNKDKDKDKDKEKNKDDKKDDKKDPMMKSDMPPPMKGDMPMDKKGMDMGKDGMPMAGMGDPMPMGGGGRKPRMGDPTGGDKKEPAGAEPQPEPMGSEKKPAEKNQKDGKNAPGHAGAGPDGKPLPKASLPFDEDVAKDVWGHLPDKLRQQMTQYYKEDVMPKYAELLRLYYSSLSEKGGAPAPPKK